MTFKSNFIESLNKKNFLFFSLIFILLSLFFAPTHISANEYAFISRALQFFNTNEKFIGFSDSIRLLNSRAVIFLL